MLRNSGFFHIFTKCSLVLTFIQPITETVEYHALLPGGNQADDPALHGGSVVDVILKYKDLKTRRRRRRRENHFFWLVNEEGLRSCHMIQFKPDVSEMFMQLRKEMVMVNLLFNQTSEIPL